MGPEDTNNKSRLQELRERIYKRSWRKKEQRNIRPTYYGKEREVQSTWSKDEDLSSKTQGTPKDTLSMFKKVFIGSLVFFFVALGVAGYFFLGEGNVVSSENVEIVARGPVAIAGGDEFSLQIGITNNNPVPIEFTDLVIEYPAGVHDPNDTSRELSRFRESLGVIQPGETVNTIARSVLFGEEGSEKDIQIALEYRLRDSNAIFVKEASHFVSISSSPISLSLETLREVNSNQEMELVVNIVSNAEQTIENVALRIDYPFGFEPQEAEPEPSIGADMWHLGTVEPDESFTVTVRGTIHAQDEEEKVFSAHVGTQQDEEAREIATVYSSSFKDVLVRKPFLGMRIILDGLEQEEHVASGDTRVRGRLAWVNNTASRIVDANIRMTIEGESLNEHEVGASNGFYDSTTNTITWNKTQEPRLADLEPGASGDLSFHFQTLPLFSNEARSIRNPTLRLTLDAQGRRVSEEGAIEDIRSVVERTVKIASDLALSARMVHFVGPFANSGPMPPRAEQNTQYTAIWTVSNSSNDVAGGEVRARLPSYVSWLGATDPVNANIRYNPITREVIWDIGDIPAGTGSVQSAFEVAFQVSILPSISQIGTTPVLLDDITLRGEDTFTNTTLQKSYNQLTTQLATDPQFEGRQGTVTE